MKKPTILLLLFLFPAVLISQTSLGFFAGLNNSKLKGDSPKKASYKSLMGLNAGIYLDVQLHKIVFLSFQPSYSQEGTRVSYKVTNQDKAVDSLRIRFNYFSLPILVKITSTNKKWYALSGIETGYLLNSFIDNGAEKENLNDDILKINVAIIFGAGLRIPLRFGRFFIELRYTQGLINLTDEPLEDTNSAIPRVKTSGMKLFAGYEIPLTKNKE